MKIQRKSKEERKGLRAERQAARRERRMKRIRAKNCRVKPQKPTRSPLRRLLRVMVGAVCAGALCLLLGACFAVGLYVWIDRTTDAAVYAADEVPAAQAALVPGAQVHADGRPSWALRYRLDTALSLYEAGRVKKILVSGDHGQAEYDEVNAMRDYLLAAGVPREDIFMDHAGFDTYDTLYRARDVFAAESLVIVTQDFHLRRALFLAEALELPAVGVAAQDIHNPVTMLRMYIREAGARVKALWDVVNDSEPTYLGTVLPLSGDGTITEG